MRKLTRPKHLIGANADMRYIKSRILNNRWGGVAFGAVLPHTYVYPGVNGGRL